MKPAVFIGSSVESLKLAYAIQEELAYDAEITVWPQGIFKLSSTTLDDLLDTLGISDFSIFIFSPDDEVKIGGQDFLSTRDNVIFELGLFIGRLGKQRNFFILPEEHSNFRLPSDLLGVTPATFDANRSDGNLRAALGPACNRIRETIAKLGKVQRIPAMPSIINEQPEVSYYHVRVQQLVTGRETSDEPKFRFNLSKNSFMKIATNLYNGENIQVADESISGIEIITGVVSISLLRSTEQAKISKLAGMDSKVKEQYWDELQHSDNVVDITAELDITNIYAKKERA
jgi:hypothetical protein